MTAALRLPLSTWKPFDDALANDLRSTIKLNLLRWHGTIFVTTTAAQLRCCALATDGRSELFVSLVYS